jgi:hypothetical protein
MIKEDRDSKVNAFAGDHEIGKLRRRKVKDGQGPKVKGSGQATWPVIPRC